MTAKKKRRFKKFTAEERKALKLDEVPDTMYRLDFQRDPRRVDSVSENYDPRDNEK